MLAAQALIAALEAEGVSYIFGYPGGQALKIYDALYDSSHITHILARHEQGAVHEADGYARATGEVGVVLVTSGPGATNTVTGIATACMDSVPLVVLTGQVQRGAIGTDSFQESDIVGITMPVVKHSFLVKDAQAIPQIIHDAFYIAKSGRPGPVLIDLPSDAVSEDISYTPVTSHHLPSYKPTYKGNSKQIKRAVSELVKARRPLLHVGGGAITSQASEALIMLMDEQGIPAVTTLMAKGALPSTHPLNLGAVGQHGSKYANKSVMETDLLIACGTRFSDRVTGNVRQFAPHARVIHIDIDPAEISKIIHADVPIVGDVKRILGQLLDELHKQDIHLSEQFSDWRSQVNEWKREFPLRYRSEEQACGAIVPERAIELLSSKIQDSDTIVTTDVGQHQMWSALFLERRKPRSFLTSGGLGTMGFGLPAAIGASLGCPDKQVICISGDGSFQMNVQEMATARVNNLPIKVVLFNNYSLGMVHQLQNMFYQSRYYETELYKVLDFALLARAYGWESMSIQRSDEVSGAFDTMLASPNPFLLELTIPTQENVFPMVPPGSGLDDMWSAADIAVGAVYNENRDS